MGLPVRVVTLAFFLGASHASCRHSGNNPRAPSQVPVSSPVILRTLPHDTSSFTQGLLYCGGLLYESTGLYGESKLRVIDPADGRVIKTVPVAPETFAEGLAQSGDRLVQLTWRENAAMVYSFPGLRLIGTFTYQGEGWGLTVSGANFVMSNGSDTLVFRNQAFSIVRRLPVTLRGKPVPCLNELESVNGMIYANVWYNDFIFAINETSGAVERLIDCSSLVKDAATPSPEYVLNGIAYKAESGTFFVTGKMWGKMFEVRME